MSITAKFLDPLRLESLADHRWRLLEEFRYDSAIFGARIIVPAGRITDLASVPHVPFAYWLAGDRGRKAAVIHDELYGNHYTSRRMADAVFLEALGVEGEPPWLQRVMWLAVRFGHGGGPWSLI